MGLRNITSEDVEHLRQVEDYVAWVLSLVVAAWIALAAADDLSSYNATHVRWQLGLPPRNSKVRWGASFARPIAAGVGIYAVIYYLTYGAALKSPF